MPSGSCATESQSGAKCSILLPTESLLKSTIALKPHPSNLSVKPRVLRPLMLLPREAIPLSSLDLCHPNGDFSASRFYESHIKILELEGRLGSNVLLASSETNRVIYAIERDASGLYVLCKLGPWADIAKLGEHATVICMQRLEACKLIQDKTAGSLPFTTPQLHRENKKKRLAIEEIQSIVKKRARSQSLSTLDRSRQGDFLSIEGTKGSAVEAVQTCTAVGVNQSKAQIESEQIGPLPNPDAEKLSDDITQALPTAEDIFQNIWVQYFEALYHSMGSLAYFAKGPLSRARAAFHLDCDSNLDMNDLIDFLKGLVMTTALIDKKYRETVPEIISRLKTLTEDSEAEGFKPKRRKMKKMKLGKDGLYPSEYDHVRRWWAAQQPQASGDDGKTMTPEEVKYHVSCLRRRETQLQMIMILEILALEPLGRQLEVLESQLPGMESQNAAREASSESAHKRRNKHNFPVLLDVHADRLCIWQSTTLNGMKALAESQANSSQAQATENPGRPNSDPLKDFCMDVILPFFSARLPTVCDTINRKLGGPVIKSSTEARLSKMAAPAKPRPGAPTKRSVSSRKDRDRTLERVLSNERMRRSVSRGPTDAMALMRSASATAIPGLKREGSEPLMVLASQGEKAPFKEKSTHLFARSTSIGSMEDLKTKQKALVEAELKEAISALKKPNRALAGKEIAEEAERRTFASVTQLKRLKKPNRVSGLQSVQVKATPANNRFTDVIAAEVGYQEKLQQSQLAASEEVSHTPSSSSLVPSSAAPRRSAHLFTSSSATATRLAAEELQASPGTELSSEPPILRDLKHGNRMAIPPSSPILARKAATATGTQFFPVLGSSGHEDGDDLRLPSSPGLPALFETPLQPRSAIESVELIMSQTPCKSRLFEYAGRSRVSDKIPAQTKASTTAEGGGKLSIYQRLGWDNDDLDELA